MGIMLDMYRRPDKLVLAMEVFTPLMIRMGVNRAKGNGNPIVVIPLHKGVKKLIEVCGEGGGFIVMNGAIIEKAKSEKCQSHD